VSGVGPAPFSLTVVEDNGRVVIAVRGELDLATAPQLEDTVLPVVRDGRDAVIDLRELEFMDSTGVRVMVAAHLAAQEAGARLAVVRSQRGSAVHRVLEVSGLDGVLDMVDDLDS
jgi:anti-anti-sigma factor